MHIPRIPTSSQSIAESIPTPLLKNGEGNLYVKGDERRGEGEGERGKGMRGEGRERGRKINLSLNEEGVG